MRTTRDVSRVTRTLPARLLLVHWLKSCSCSSSFLHHFFIRFLFIPGLVSHVIALTNYSTEAGRTLQRGGSRSAELSDLRTSAFGLRPLPIEPRTFPHPARFTLSTQHAELASFRSLGCCLCFWLKDCCSLSSCICLVSHGNTASTIPQRRWNQPTNGGCRPRNARPARRGGSEGPGSEF